MKHTPTCDCYAPSHPWYYKLGGKSLYPKQIQSEAIQSSARGYRTEEIEKARCLPEPKRSSKLHKIRGEVCSDLQRDLSVYRGAAFALHIERINQPPDERPTCSNAHVAMSLKYCHLINGLAHLHLLGSLLSQQPDLFG